MAIRVVLDLDEGTNGFNFKDPYVAICDANKSAWAYYIQKCIDRQNCRTKIGPNKISYYIRNNKGKVESKAKNSTHGFRNSFVFETVPVVEAIKKIDKLCNGDKEPFVVASDHPGLVNYANYFLKWDAPETEEVRELKSYQPVSEIVKVNSMLENVRSIVEEKPIFIAQVKNGRWKRDNIAHVLADIKAEKQIKQSNKRIRKSLNNLVKTGNSYYASNLGIF
ncbi:MAG: hypothetical protein JW700_00935 [Candidatus Aenigmarchaeota archaeon]|nr:hypothetical protein [Candidatus Aenigmarchaeota archaeon]